MELTIRLFFTGVCFFLVALSLFRVRQLRFFLEKKPATSQDVLRFSFVFSNSSLVVCVCVCFKNNRFLSLFVFFSPQVLLF